MRTTLSFYQKSDFLSDLVDAFFRLPDTLVRFSGVMLRSLVRAGATAGRWFLSDRGQFILILAMAAVVLGLQLRSLL